MIRMPEGHRMEPGDRVTVTMRFTVRMHGRARSPITAEEVCREVQEAAAPAVAAALNERGLVVRTEGGPPPGMAPLGAQG